jgi:hypothetical protein
VTEPPDAIALCSGAVNQIIVTIEKHVEGFLDMFTRSTKPRSVSQNHLRADQLRSL